MVTKESGRARKDMEKARFTTPVGRNIQVIGSMTIWQENALSLGLMVIDTRLDVHKCHTVIGCDNQHIIIKKYDD